mmetsp:Transcript_84678/g.220457  ORF Transcript_84678/g.220457 Transcript_84678/m.220457 type:complete len:441 (+) Transcript_84678:110-1432(+)
MLALPGDSTAVGTSRSEGVAATAGARHRHCVLEAPEPPSDRGNNFTKGVRWSPDGSTLLASHDDAALRLYQVPSAAVSGDSGWTGGDRGLAAPPLRMEPYAQVQEGGPVLDFCFFPSFTWENPATCCFIASSQDHPIHLREAATGTLCNTYRPYNQVDEVCHSFSLCFSPDGGKILGGFQQYIRVFDVQRPGRQVEDWLLSTRKGKGQKGIIGAIAANSMSPGVYAAGSYNRSVCVYHEGSRGKPVARLVDNEPDYEMGGVTQLLWASEWLLLSGHRRDRWLRAWDLRMASSAEGLGGGGLHPKALLHRFPRCTRTHQRFLFSVQGCQLAVGDDQGSVFLHSLSTFEEEECIPRAHERPCVSAMLHPFCRTLATSGGGRVFPDYDVDSSAGSLSPPPRRKSTRKRSCSRGKAAKHVKSLKPLDNSVRVWQLEPSGDEAQH